MIFYCLIGQEMLNFVTNCCKLLKVNQAAEREVSSTEKRDCTISVAVTTKLICVFVFACAKSRFSHDAAHMGH